MKIPARKNDILVKMAAYNEGNNIASVLMKMPSNVDVLVIDDGSEDNTAEVARKYGAMVVRHFEKMGQAVADSTGFYVAFDMGYEYIVEMDADGQHDSEDIPRFVNALKENPNVDIIVGSRILGGQDDNACTIRTGFLPHYTRMINWATGYHLTDGLCGYKAFRGATLQRHADIFRNLVEPEYAAAELYIRFSGRGLRVMELPVFIARRKSGKSRKGTLRYGFAVAWIILRTWLDKKRSMNSGSVGITYPGDFDK